MKKYIILIFIITFSFQSIANDIYDLEIEGISIGNNILDFYTNEQILNNTQTYYKSNKFKTVEFLNLKSLKTYDVLQLNFKTDDNIIHEVTGIISYEFNIDDCYEKMDSVIEDILNYISVSDQSEKIVDTLKQDSTGKSKMTVRQLYFKSGYSQIGCYDWSTEKGWVDHMRISIRTNDFSDWSESNLLKN